MEDFVTVVKGGSSESITALLAKKLPSPELMNLWGDGVRFNPDFIRRTVSLFVFHHTSRFLRHFTKYVILASFFPILTTSDTPFTPDLILSCTFFLHS